MKDKAYWPVWGRVVREGGICYGGLVRVQKHGLAKQARQICEKLAFTQV